METLAELKKQLELEKRKKQEAIETENFLLAHQQKEEIARLEIQIAEMQERESELATKKKQLEENLALLLQQKQQAIQDEDFLKANDIKVRIESIQADLAQLSKNNATVEQPSKTTTKDENANNKKGNDEINVMKSNLAGTLPQQKANPVPTNNTTITTQKEDSIKKDTNNAAEDLPIKKKMTNAPPARLPPIPPPKPEPSKETTTPKNTSSDQINKENPTTNNSNISKPNNASEQSSKPFSLTLEGAKSDFEELVRLRMDIGQYIEKITSMIS